jgi:hypothetical protein
MHIVPPAHSFAESANEQQVSAHLLAAVQRPERQVVSFEHEAPPSMPPVVGGLERPTQAGLTHTCPALPEKHTVPGRQSADVQHGVVQNELPAAATTAGLTTSEVPQMREPQSLFAVQGQSTFALQAPPSGEAVASVVPPPSWGSEASSDPPRSCASLTIPASSIKAPASPPPSPPSSLPSSTEGTV